MRSKASATTFIALPSIIPLMGTTSCASYQRCYSPAGRGGCLLSGAVGGGTPCALLLSPPPGGPAASGVQQWAQEACGQEAFRVGNAPSVTSPQRMSRLAFLLLPLLLLVAPRAQAQADAGVAAPAVVVEPGSPSAAVNHFLELVRAKRYAEAAAYLELPRGTPTQRAAQLAKRLNAVFDRRLPVDPNGMSPRAEGNPDDALPPGVDQVGTIPGPTGRAEPVLLVHRQTPEGPRWLFSAATVARVDAWYATIGDRWIYEHLPAFLLQPGPRGLLLWQWLLVVPLVMGAWLLGRLLGRATQGLLGRVAARTATRWDDVVLARISAPLTAAWGVLLVSLVVPWLDLEGPGADFAHQALKVAAFIVFFWMLMRVLDAMEEFIATSHWAQARPATRSLVPLGRRVAKVLLAAVAAVAVVDVLGYPVASLIAGLGIGGLAVALAAQKTVENLFGAFSLGVDQPFREGDFVKVEDFVGTVESIGLRSTRIRTLDRTLISVPNGKLADMRLESYAARDRLRLAADIGLAYGTTPAQMRAVLEGMEAILRAQPKLWPDVVSVKFKAFGENALLVEVMAWFKTTDWFEFEALRQEVYLQFMDLVERVGTSFAIPPRMVHLVDEPAGRR
jgi:MscS family membrane protein